MTLLEARIQILLLILLLFCMKTLLWEKNPVGEGIRVNVTHVVKTVRPYLPEVGDEKVSLLQCIFRIHL